MRHKGRELEIGKRKKRQGSKKEKRELSWEGRSRKGEVKEEIWTISSLLPRKPYKQQKKEMTGTVERRRDKP